jgi:hypothetical protein
MTARTKQELYDRFCSTGSAKRSISQIETRFEDLIDTFFGTWTPYHDTSTITGWSSFTEKLIYYYEIGNMVWVNFAISGVSNATSASFTLPSTTAAGVVSTAAIQVEDNGTTQADSGLAQVTAGSATVNCYKEMDATVFTNSGNKGVGGQLFYVKA